MANTIPDGIYYPEGTTLVNLDAMLATMASSIQNGIGKRLALQELAVGLKASVADASFSITNTVKTVPYAVSSEAADFNNGFTITGGIAKVVTPAMYYVTASVGASTAPGRGIKIFLSKNNVRFAISEVPQQAEVWVNTQANCVINCVAGDTIKVEAVWTGTGAGSTNLMQRESNYLSIAMVQALPV